MSPQTLHFGWRFVPEDVKDAQIPDFDDSTWQTVAVPHTWNLDDGHDGGNDYYRGPGWYRRNLTIDPQLAGKTIYLRFGAASLVAKVYLNGQFVGEHRGGFAAFCFDITSVVKPGDNILAVQVNNAVHPDVAPLAGDFTIFGGLYRDVELIALAPVHVSKLDHGSPGVYLRQLEVSEQQARVEVTTLVRNASSSHAAPTVKTRILDADGRTVTTHLYGIDLASGVSKPVTQVITMKPPRLWDGVRDPYCYRAVVSVIVDEKTVDEVEQPLGLRYFHFDRDNGLILNGRPYPWRGVNHHQEVFPRGWAVNWVDQERDYALIRELGCTGVRMAHYQHAPYEYQICDRTGLVVWDELALVNDITASAEFTRNARQQLTELIRQNYNHPSILVWSLFNEINIADGDPRWNLVRELNALAHELDPSRPTTAALNLDLEHEEVTIPDIVGFNRYWGWYSDNPDEWPQRLDEIRAKVSDRPIGMSEYGAGASVRQHELLPMRPKPDGPWHPEQWQCLFHEAAWKAQASRPYLWCNLIWVMFDFASDGRNEGDQPGRNDKGLVTADRGIRKDAFFFYKANWSDEPFVHIVSRRYNPRPAGEAPVKVYSNCESVELIVNGRSFGTRQGDHGVFVWEDIPFIEGDMEVLARGTSNAAQFHDSVVWQVGGAATTQKH